MFDFFFITTLESKQEIDKNQNQYAESELELKWLKFKQYLTLSQVFITTNYQKMTCIKLLKSTCVAIQVF